MLTPQDIDNLAALGRLALSEDEKTAIAKDLESILGYVSELSNAPAGQAADVYASTNVMREDGAPHEAGVHTEALLAEAPKREGGYLKVKQILGGGDNA
ncbi:MAG TPA: Asp-tRNA(Asn)/Glu-tRNA(Gln) amidotransferase subunit GatC [Candidatus Paceibacterota bacterium]|nr:Asp-tRNA(Asn)/Glu-tRNA(Gln) amidotransferase subunit GatC [Candidatus Paceibacterota bacterium]